jgi:hypothetical protein
MTESSSIIPDASALTVDTSCIDCSEVESQEDKDFLVERGRNILEIVAWAALKVGHQVNLVQKRFEGSRTGKLTKFYDSLGISEIMARKWSCKYRLYCDYVEGNGGDETTLQAFNHMNDNVAQLVDNMPYQEREDCLKRIGAGVKITKEEASEISNKTETKLNKAEELLFGSHDRLDDAQKTLDSGVTGVERDRARSAKSNAEKSIAKFEQQIADLQAQIEEEKLKTAKQHEENAKLETELQKMKFDDASVRADRVKRVSNQLLVQVPAVLSEVQKFYAEIEHYDNNTRDFLEEQLDMLTGYLKDHR